MAKYCTGRVGLAWKRLSFHWKRFGKGLGKLDFQAVIKSAASAASPTAWELHGSARATGNGGTTGTAGRRTGSRDGFGALPCTSQAVGEAVLAADLIMA